MSLDFSNNTRDTQEFKDIQAALDKITTDTRNEYMKNAVENAPAGE